MIAGVRFALLALQHRAAVGTCFPVSRYPFRENGFTFAFAFAFAIYDGIDSGWSYNKDRMGGRDGGFSLDDDDGSMGKCNIDASNGDLMEHNRNCNANGQRITGEFRWRSTLSCRCIYHL